MLIGYAWVLMDDQNLCIQKDALLETGCERIFEDRLSGRNRNTRAFPEPLNVPGLEAGSSQPLIERSGRNGDAAGPRRWTGTGGIWP